MAEDIDMSLLLPMEGEGDKHTDDIISQIIDGRYELLPDQQVRLQNLINLHQKATLSEYETVTITEDDLLDILNASSSTDRRGNEIEDILNTNAIGDEVSCDVFKFVSEPAATSSSPGRTYQELQPVVLPNLSAPNVPAEPRIQHKASRTIVAPAGITSTIPSNAPLVSRPTVAAPIAKTAPTIQTVTAVPTTEKKTQLSSLKTTTTSSSQPSPTPTKPLTITLPPDLPSGRYFMKHSLSDPSTVELSFPDRPDLEPLKIPIGSPNTSEPQILKSLLVPGQTPKLTSNPIRPLVVRPPMMNQMRPRGVTTTQRVVFPHHAGKPMVRAIVRPEIARVPMTRPVLPQKSLYGRPPSNPASSAIGSASRVNISTVSPHDPSAKKSDPPAMGSASRMNVSATVPQGHKTIYGRPPAHASSVVGLASRVNISTASPSGPSAVGSASSINVSTRVAATVPQGGMRFGTPVQLSTGSAGPIRTPIKVGSVTYLPVGIPVKVSASGSQSSEVHSPVVNVAKVSSGLAMTGMNTAVPIQFEQGKDLPKSKVIEEVKIIDTLQGPKLQTVMSISSIDKSKNIVHYSSTSDVQSVLPAGGKTSQLSQEQGVPSSNTQTSKVVTYSGPSSIMKLPQTGVAKSIISRGVVNAQGKVVLTEVVNNGSSERKLSTTSVGGQDALAPISGLLNFANLDITQGNKKTKAQQSIVVSSSEQSPVPQKAIPLRTILSSPHAVTVQPNGTIEGLRYAPKLLLVDGSLDVGTEEVSDVPHFMNSLRSREQSHKMVSVTLRDNCIRFKNEARYISDLQTRHRMMKTASDLTQKKDLKLLVESSTSVKEKVSEGDANDTSQPENDGEIRDTDEPTKIRGQPKTSSVSEDNTESEGSSEDSSNKVTPTDKVETNKTEGNTKLGAENPVPDPVPDEVKIIEAKEVEGDRLKRIYSNMLKEQHSKNQERKEKLDKLIASGSHNQALSKLFLGVPHFVDDPLSGEGNAPMYFCCYLCPFASFNEAKVCVHWTLVHVHQNPYMCGYCSARFNSSGKAHRHLTLAHPNRKLIIKVMRSELFSNPVQFEFLHGEEDDGQVLCPMIEVGPKPDAKPYLKQFACKECPFTSRKEGAVMEHVQETHFNLFPYKCHCNKEFRDSWSLAEHVISEHGEDQATVTEDLQCATIQETLKLGDFYGTIPINRPVVFEPDCNYWITEENVNHREKKRYTCTLCSFLTKRINLIWKHVREEHGLPEGVYCKRCSCHHRLSDVERENEFFVCYSCCTLTSLSITGQPHFIQLKEAFLCLKCSEQVDDLVDMKRHIKIRHSDVYPYSCVVCRAKFVMKQEAFRHGLEAHRTDKVIQKQTSLLSKLARRVRKLHIRYMYVEPDDDEDPLAELWRTHGLEIMRAGEVRMTVPQAVETPNLPEDLMEMNAGGGNEGGVSIVKNVDTRYQKGEKTSDNPEFRGVHHYRCRLCPYQCLDRSCMARHVKYMHLRIHPHSCPFCGYSNVEKTKVKIHIVNLHGKSSKKVRTNTTLVTALGEESKKHFVRVFPNGREMSQTDVAQGRVQGRAMKQRAALEAELPEEAALMDDPDIKLEPLSDVELDDEVDDEHLLSLDRELKALEGSGALQIKDEPLSDEDAQGMVMGQLIPLNYGHEDTGVDMGSNNDSLGGARPKKDSVLYNMLTDPVAGGKKRKLAPTAPPAAKRKRKNNNDHSIYPVQAIMADRKLRMLPLVVLEDVLANYAAGHEPSLFLM